MKLIKIIILITILITLLYICLNYYILPFKGKTFIKNQLQNSLNREVNFDKVSYSVIKGIVLDNFSIKTKSNQPSKYLIKSKRISFNILLIPLPTKDKVIITNLKIESPYINLIKDSEGKLNIEDLLKTKHHKNKKKTSNILIAGLRLSNGNLNLYDYSKEKTYQQRITNLYASYHYSFPLSVKFKLKAKEADKKTSLLCTGNYNLKTKSISLGGKIKELDVSKLAPLIKSPFKIKEIQGILYTDFDATINKDRIISLDTISEINNLSLTAEPIKIDGAININSILQYNLKQKNIISVAGNINLKDTSIDGLPYIKQIVNLEGKLSFDKTKIAFEELKADIFKSPTTLGGLLKNFQDPYLDLNLKSELKLDKILNILPLKKDRFKNITIKGESYAALKIKGKIRRLISLDITGDISFSDVSIESKRRIFQLSGITGKINLSRNKAEIVNLTAFAKGTKYTAEGSLTDFTKPHIELKVLSDNFFCNAIVDKENDILSIKKLKGNYFGNDYNCTGEIYNLTSPIFNIYGELMLDLSDLDKFIPQSSSVISKLEPKGTIPVSLHFKGQPRKWKEAIAGLKSQVKQIYLKGLKLDNFYLNISMQDKKIFINNLSAKPYGGSLNLSGYIDLAKESPSYMIEALVKDVDLKRLTKDTKLKDKNISGLTYLKMKIMNPLKDISGLYGNGTLLITDGSLFELPLLSGLATIIGLSQFEKVVFKEAYADFVIKNRTISTENSTLISDILSLKSKGSIDFNGNLNFITDIELSKRTYESLGKSGQIAAIFFDVLGKYLIRIKTTGKLTEPHYQRLPVSSKDMIEKVLIKGLEEILKGF